MLVTGRKGRSGRPAATSRAEIAAAAEELFATQGFAATSVTEIAAAAGIGRRTFFAYFLSKAEAFWWFDEEYLRRVEARLKEAPRDDVHPLQQVIHASLSSPSRLQPTKEDTLARYQTIERTPELQIGSLRYQRQWSELIANHIRERLGPTTSDLLPEAIAAALLGVAQTVVVRWATSDDERPLLELLDENTATVRRIFEEAIRDNLLP